MDKQRSFQQINVAAHGWTLGFQDALRGFWRGCKMAFQENQGTAGNGPLVKESTVNGFLPVFEPNGGLADDLK